MALEGSAVVERRPVKRVVQGVVGGRWSYC